MSDIWKDPRVIDALQERPADDIMILDCPRCGKAGYYNQGSHFTCLHCDVTFATLSEGESADAAAMPTVSLEDVRTLADCADGEEGP